MLPSMSPEVIAVVGVGAALLGTIIPFGAIIVRGQRSLGDRLAAVDRRVARIEGALPFLAASKPDQPPR